MTVTYSDDRDVNGVPLPFRIESTSALTGRQVTSYSTIAAHPSAAPRALR